MTLVSTKLASHGNDHVLATPPLLSSPTVIIKQPRHLPAWKTNKTKVSSYFGLFFYLLSFLPFYVKSPQQARAGGRGWHTHVSFVVRTNKHSRRTIRNLRKKAKVEEEAEEEGQLPVSLSELLFVARVCDLLNLWNYFTCISDSRSVCSNLPPHPTLSPFSFLCRPFGQFLRLSLCYSDALSLQDLHTMWLGKTFTQLHMWQGRRKEA